MRNLRVSLVLAVVLFPFAASASPVTYTFQGTLNFLAGTDTQLLNGATLTIIATADTLQAPVQTPFGSGFQHARYTPVSLTASVSNRPGGASNQTFSYTSQLVTANAFAPAGSADFFFLDSASVNASPFGSIFMPAFQATFTSQTFFGGTAPAALPSFTSADVASIHTGNLTSTNRFAFSVIGATVSAQVQSVPEPSTGVAIGVGLLVVALRRRSLLRVKPIRPPI
jgi:hypothetical protein